uniref:Uncharacterized protein n=1 Tax=Anguilla anguilla TaxID=7936 RepID=A0A0E9SV83_ANGAN
MWLFQYSVCLIFPYFVQLHFKALWLETAPFLVCKKFQRNIVRAGAFIVLALTGT